MESHREKPGLYRVSAAGNRYAVHRHVEGWWEIFVWMFDEWQPYSSYNKFNKKSDAMDALKRRHQFWLDRSSARS